MGVKELKTEMVKSPENIIALLEYYNFAHIELRPREIRFARNEDGGKNISIRLENNEYLNVADYVKTTKLDIFGYIIEEKGATFKEVIKKVQEIFGLDANSTPKTKKTFFTEEIMNDIRQESAPENCHAKICDESILENYIDAVNLRFLRDHISLSTQQKFGLLYNIRTQRIGIPIRDFNGNLCGIKARRNYDTDNPDDPKYIYEVSCDKSLLLYGFTENYSSLYNASTIYIGESEKFVMQCDSYGYHNAVSLMGSSLSPKQCSMLLLLNANEYCFMFDEGLELETIRENIKMLNNYAEKLGYNRPNITWFDSRNCKLIGEKDSATDHGIDVWNNIINNYIFSADKLENNQREGDLDEI